MSKKLTLSSALSVIMMAAFVLSSPGSGQGLNDSAGRSMVPAKVQLGGFEVPESLPFSR